MLEEVCTTALNEALLGGLFILLYVALIGALFMLYKSQQAQERMQQFLQELQREEKSQSERN